MATSASGPVVTVAVCTYNRPALLRQTLRTLLDQDCPASYFEVLVVDNNSPPGTREVVEEFGARPGLRYVLETQQGLSHARNRAIDEARGTILAYADDDVIAARDWLRHLVAGFEGPEKARIGAIGGTVVPLFLEGCPPWASYWELPMKLTETLAPLADNVFPMGASMAFPMWIFAEVGRFRPDLGRLGKSLLAGEEAELMGRIQRAGYQVWFAPDSVLQHVMPASRLTLGYVCRNAFDSARSRVIGRVKYESQGGLDLAGFLVTRLLVNLIKAPWHALGFLAWHALLQPSKAKAELVRAARAAGYVYAVLAPKRP
jgi:glucosyl-dolichyl phosphate glucuronosyltransferase